MASEREDPVDPQPWTTNLEDGVSTEPARLGFGAGARTVVNAFGWLISTPRVWAYALVPVSLLVLLGAYSVYFVIDSLKPRLDSFFAGAAGVVSQVLAISASWVAVVLACLLGLTLAWLLTPLLSAPALEKIVRERERSLGAEARSDLSILQELVCGLSAQAAAGLVVAPALIALWLLDEIFPPAVLFTLPLKFLLMVLALAWGLLDYPLTLRGVGFRERWALLRDQPLPVLGFGTALLVLFWLPLSSIVLLPVGAAAAAELRVRLSRQAHGAGTRPVTVHDR